MRIAIIGSRGRLGAALAREWAPSHEIIPLARPEIDLEDAPRLRGVLERLDFDAAINCAANTSVDACESQRDAAFAANVQAPETIAEVCASKRARMIHISTDYVFDGVKRTPYTEEDPANPKGIYAITKFEGEGRVLARSPSHIVARVSWVFGPDKPSFVDMMIDRAEKNDRVESVADKWSSPTYTIDAARWLEALLDPKIPGGIYHLCNSGEATWQEYAQYAIDCARRCGVRLRASIVEPLRLADMKAFIAPRGVYSVMSTAKLTSATGLIPATWQNAVERYVEAKFLA